MNIVLGLAVFFCILGIFIGQLPFKQAAALPATLSLFALPHDGWSSITLGWVEILCHAQLRVVYSFLGLAFLMVPLLAHVFLGELPHRRTLAGGALIMAGVASACAN